MNMYQYENEMWPQLKIKVGTHVRKMGETLEWEVVEYDEYTVVLQGPAGRKGKLVISRDDLNRDWVKA